METMLESQQVENQQEQQDEAHDAANSRDGWPYMTATYSPEDNKLRLYASSRLPKELYLRVKEAGFIYAPKQELFVAPMWTPGREDLLLDLCGEIGDEDKSLVDRAEERADRFDGYSDSREKDAESARRAVHAIADHIPFGQPILVGHHSERRARRDAQRIEDGMRRAVKMWETSEYWTRRAAGAIAHAKYKELPDVRYRRIKKLEAERRKCVSNRDHAQQALSAWSQENLTLETAIRIADIYSFYVRRKEGDREDFNQQPSAHTALTNAYPNLYAPRTLAEVVEGAKALFPRSIAKNQRWINHYDNRIAYERAMLGEQGGLVAEGVEMKPGGRVLVRGEWLTIVRINKKDGKPVSVTTNARFVRVRGIEEIKQYEPPTEEKAQAVAAAMKLAPIANYPGEGFAHLTKAEWERIPKDYKGFKRKNATDKAGAHRVRHAIGVYVYPQERDSNKRHHYYEVFITDDKRKEPPPVTSAAPAAAPAIEPPTPDAPRTLATVDTDTRSKDAAPTENAGEAFRAMKEQLRNGGVQVVTAPQLFPTPAPLAERLIQEADIRPGHRFLEPEAGTARILRALAATIDLKTIEVVAVEINQALSASLRGSFPDVNVICADFLQCHDLGKFDRICLNPPFANGADIDHILHALTMLNEGGRLTGICAAGPRQKERLMPVISQHGGIWEDLPAGSFQPSGTMVNAALIIIDL